MNEVNEFRNPLTKAANRIASGALSPIERWLVNRYSDSPCKCVFIVGPPRSGSTLLYEMLVTRYSFAYITNLTQRLFRVPVTMSLLQRPFVKRRVPSYDSVYGQIKGFSAPSENGRIWRYWLPKHAPYNISATGSSISEIRRNISAVSYLMGGPFLCKYLKFSSQIEMVAELFPDSVFLHMQRDPSMMVRSNLRRWRRIDPTHEQDWCAILPKEWAPYEKCNGIKQAAAQVALIQKDIAESIVVIGVDRGFQVEYEALCEDPQGILAKVQSFLAGHGMSLEDRGEIPRSFPASPLRLLDEETESEIIKELALFGLSEKHHQLV